MREEARAALAWILAVACIIFATPWLGSRAALPQPVATETRSAWTEALVVKEPQKTRAERIMEFCLAAQHEAMPAPGGCL